MAKKIIWRRMILVVIATVFLAGGCAPAAADPSTAQNVKPQAPASPSATPVKTPEASSPAQTTAPPTPSKTPEGMSVLAEGFTSQIVPQEVRARMMGKSYPEDCPVSFDDLRYLRLLHTGFDGETHEGEMVVNVKIADDVLEIFKELYDAKYPIEKIRLIDDYDAVDEAAMTDNNTSGFCYRTISGKKKLSYHARGLAVDVNTLYNPFISAERIEPMAGEQYARDRNTGNPYFIDEDDLCYQLFTEHGFFWGGHFEGRKDYQHFQMED